MKSAIIRLGVSVAIGAGFLVGAAPQVASPLMQRAVDDCGEFEKCVPIGNVCDVSNPFDAVNDNYTTPYQTAKSVATIYNNDTYCDEPIDINDWETDIVTDPQHGTLNASLVYTPNAGFSGTDTFTYVIGQSWDEVPSGIGAENVGEMYFRYDIATVTITVGDPPQVLATTLLATTTTTATVQAATLAATGAGSETTSLVVGGMGSLMAGSGMLFAARRRRRHRS